MARDDVDASGFQRTYDLKETEDRHTSHRLPGDRYPRNISSELHNRAPKILHKQTRHLDQPSEGTFRRYDRVAICSGVSVSSTLLENDLRR